MPRARTSSPAVTATPARDVTLVEDGLARAALFVDARVMSGAKVNASTAAAREAEDQRVRLRESVLDLARTLQKVSGGRLEIVTEPRAAGDARTPIFIGERAERVFGRPAVRAPFAQGFRLVVSSRGVGLLGESDLATSYAIYELLFRLGCRWFIPGELGEVLPVLPTVVMPEVDVSSAPSTTFRGIWYADDAYRRRNRHGGLQLQIGQWLEGYVTEDDRAKHPEWMARIGGHPDRRRLRWSNAALATRIADELIARQEKDPVPSYSLSPEDGEELDSSAEDTALDAGDFDPSTQRVSVTDRLLVLCNRIAARVATRAPDVLLGVLAYAQFTRSPVRERVHPLLVPSIAPIDYSRFHPMSDDAVPGNRALRDLIVGWGKAARQTSFYAYGYNLAEPTAPQPMLAKWAFDVPFILANGCKFWQPETLPTFETQMHALYLGNRLAWNATERAEDVARELHTLFYAHAAEPMATYWRFVDEVWVKTPEYAGSAYGYARRWTPDRLTTARALLTEGKRACVTPVEARRVQLADDSLELFERFMKMRFDLAEGRFLNLGHDASRWRRRIVELADQYKEQHCFTGTPWSPETYGGALFKQFFQRTYEDAAAIAMDFDIVTPSPVRRFRWHIDADRAGERLGWAKREFDDRGWGTTDVCVDTWSTLGHHDDLTSMWYRARVDVPPASGGQKRATYLWIAGTDGSAKVFVDGTHVPYVDEHGPRGEFEGFSVPASFDVSSQMTRGGVHQIAILCRRIAINELGTGGLLGPVVVYRRREG